MVKRIGTAYWNENLALLANQNSLAVSVLYQDRGNSYSTGLYFWSEGVWRFVLSYEQVANFVVNGGETSIYAGLSQTVDVPSGALVYRNGVLVPGAVQIAPDGTNALWLILYLSNVNIGRNGTVKSVGLTAPAEISVSGVPITDSGTIGLTWTTQQPNQFFAGPASGSSANTPQFRSLTSLDLPQGANPTWPAPYDGGSSYTPGADSTLATRDLVKNAISGALGNFATIIQVDSTTGTLPQTSQGTLWAMNFATANGLPIKLPALGTYVAPFGQWNGTTFSFINVGIYPGSLEVAPTTADYILWGGNQLTSVIVNPGESLTISYYYWNGQQQWVVAGGTALAQANDTYIAIMESSQQTAVPVTAMDKKQIYLTGTLTARSSLTLPNYGEWVIVNGTVGAQNIYVLNQAYPSGQSLILLPGCNVHVTTGDYGTLKGQMAGIDIAIQTSNNSIDGNAYPLIAPATPNPLVLNSSGDAVLYLTGPMLMYHTQEIIDDTLGSMTQPIVYTFNPDFYTFQGGQWTFFNNLQQASPKSVFVGDLQGTQIQIPVGKAVTVIYTSSGKIYQV
jgi:hypothetical protein